MLSKVLAFGQVTPPGSSACETEACAGRKFCFLAYTGARRKHWHHNYECLPQACAKACESPKTPSKASDASEWSATMACVGGTASAARLKRPKSSAQRGDGLRGRRHPQLGRAGEFAAQTNFPDAWGRMLVARPDFGRSPQHRRPPGSSGRRAQQRWRPALAGSGCVTYVRTR